MWLLSRSLSLFLTKLYTLKKILGPKRDEVKEEWRNLRNEELDDLYCSPNIILVIKSRRVRWAGHVARMGRGEVRTGFWWVNAKERATWKT